jgi:hypothetical protein
MITLAADCLVFQLASGENVPFSADMISVDLAGETGKLFDEEFVRNATKAVFYYFKHEKGRQTVSIGEFAEALEHVLGGFAEAADLPVQGDSSREMVESDLALLARETSTGCELLFFQRLRQEVRRHAQENREVLRFSGLRECVKQLLGARRWGGRCRSLEEQILSYLRECLSAEVRSGSCSVLVR